MPVRIERSPKPHITRTGPTVTLRLPGAKGDPGVADDASVAALVDNAASDTAASLNASYARRWSTSIDLCSAPHNLQPGDDTTAALQAAIDTIAATNESGEIYWSQPGTYYLNGAQQTGTNLGINYSGQILLPPVAIANGLAIRIRGAGPLNMGGTSRRSSGTRLVSNATSGYIFDTVPDHERFASGIIWSEVVPIFEDLIIEGPTDPTCGGINATVAAAAELRNVLIEGGSPPPDVALTGTQEAVLLPQVNNQGNLVMSNVTVRGWGRGVRVREHAVFDNVRLTLCGVGVTTDGGAHGNVCSRLNIEGCPTVFKSLPAVVLNPCILSGTLDWEATALTTPSVFLDTDQDDRFAGSLAVKVSEPEGGLPWKSSNVSNRYSFGRLDLTNLEHNGGRSWMNTRPVDTFKRGFTPLSDGAPGLAWPTLHPWVLRNGGAVEVVADVTAPGISDGYLQSTNGATPSNCLLPSHGESRTVQAQVTLSATTPTLRVIAGWPQGGPDEGNWTALFISGNKLLLQCKTDAGEVTLATTADSPLTGLGGTTHDFGLEVLTDAAGLPRTLTGYFDGAQVLTANLTTAQAAELGRGNVFPFLHDGIQFREAGSQVRRFEVLPPNLAATAIDGGAA